MAADDVRSAVEPNPHILKCRDDARPIEFTTSPEDPDTRRQFLLLPEHRCGWAKPEEPFGLDTLRARIEPWLTALCQSEHFSLLVGSGISRGVHKLGTAETFPETEPVDLGSFSKEIEDEASRFAKAAGRNSGNIEDRIRSANQLLRGLQILGSSNDKIRERALALQGNIAILLKSFADAVFTGERNVMKSETAARNQAFNYLVSFLMSFASRTGTRDRLHIFTTNYDRFIEAGSDIAGLHLLDRFTGTLAPLFRSSRLDLDIHYNPPGIRGEPRYLEGVARFTKLHGSLDWFECEEGIRRVGIPFGVSDIEPYIESLSSTGDNLTQMLIYPNSSKDRETAQYPYVELFRDFSAAICRPNHTLVCFGYSFGDEHINRVVEDMLTIPSTHLVIIAYDDPMRRIMNLYDRVGRHAQISLMIGEYVGDFKVVVDNYLPKPAIDKTTLRMTELLESRWGAHGVDATGLSGDGDG